MGQCRSMIGASAQRLLFKRTDLSVEDQERLDALLQERNTMFTRIVLRGGAAICSIRALPVLVHLAIGDGQRMTQGVPSATFATLFALTVVASCCPQLVVPWSLPVWHCMIMGVLSLLVSPMVLELEPSFLMIHLGLHMGTVLVGLIGCSLWPPVISNLVFGTCVIAHFPETEGFRDIGLLEVLVAEFTSFGCKVAIFCAARVVSHQGACNEVLIVHNAMSSLLDLVCDAVVEVDDDLMMTAHCAKLANMLMHGNGKDLSGASFQEYVVNDAGQETFESKIRRSTRGHDGAFLPGMFSCQIRDAIGNHLEVLCFHVPYATVGGSVHHVLGVQEGSCDSKNA
eukprot:CAMPEP_0176034440 /NCGR_PEP_ID=MMETSP0120_2-20121206/17024_1 /TAXON_ID=160619 /ORGANISM="Kryptoperidinium foliaceum, Strain CCMP 1326" /LENGTH=340 /DNA_ID=CAMNT_0017367781 /DNA_START=163 /DNA_END=1183 /DNA_ORIENTATION=-